MRKLFRFRSEIGHDSLSGHKKRKGSGFQHSNYFHYSYRRLTPKTPIIHQTLFSLDGKNGNGERSSAEPSSRTIPQHQAVSITESELFTWAIGQDTKTHLTMKICSKTASKWRNCSIEKTPVLSTERRRSNNRLVSDAKGNGM